MNFKAAIFDLDGTLVNSLDDLADAMNSVLSRRGLPVHPREAYRYFVGRGIRNLVHNALPEAARDDEIIAECYQLMMDAYSRNYVVKTRPYDGITDLLGELKSRGMKLGVLSNKADEFTKNIVQTLTPGYFDKVVGFTTEALKKPNPAAALQISESFGVQPDEVLYIGDSGVDMQTAQNAGMYGVGVLWGFRTKEEIVSNGAKTTLAHPLDLMELLKN
ncbi:MAG: HAD family hydrolase [Dysgonamonadaceae bacterium]|jgi:phosphoglycolate phosphatase|nr:HAD family hydrolase [Dysgonamonadaceae bacterium]